MFLRKMYKGYSNKNKTNKKASPPTKMITATLSKVFFQTFIVLKTTVQSKLCETESSANHCVRKAITSMFVQYSNYSNKCS